MNRMDRLLAWLEFNLLRWLNGTHLKGHSRNFWMGSYCRFSGRSCWTLGENNIFDWACAVEVQGQLVMGSGNYFNKNIKIVCFDKIEIGNHCLFADSVHLYDHDHRFDRLDILIKDQGYTTAPIKIGNNVWLGAKVTVLKGVTIGDGVVVGANSVVTSDLPANSVCGGIPAKVIKIRP